MKRKAIVILVVLTVVSGIIIGYFSIGGASSITGPPGSETLRFSGMLDGENDYNLHTVRVLDNVTTMRFILTAYGDFDLYGKLGDTPTISNSDFRSIAYGNEDYSLESPNAGVWHLMVRSYEGSGHYDLTVILT